MSEFCECSCKDIIIEMTPEGVDGVGIASIELVSTVGLVKNYRINLTNGTHFDYSISDGSSIASIAKTDTQVLVDIYTVTLTNGDTTTFEVTNGRAIVSVVKTNTSVLTDTYTISYNDNTTSTFDVVNGNGIVSIEKTNTSVLTDTYTIRFSNNTTTTFQVVNGRGITSITKTGSDDLVDHYRVLYNDGTYTDYNVTNGMPCTHSWNGTVLTITSYSGTSSADLKGEKGDTATVAVGTVTTGAEGSSATVTNVGTANDAIFNFSIPRGNTGNGISSIALLSTSGLQKTYRVTYTNGNHFDYVVSDGNGIASIAKTGTSGATDTYTITFTDPNATPFTYEVVNGSDEWGAIVGDLSDQQDLQRALDDKLDAELTAEQTGEIVQFNSETDHAIKHLTVGIEPVQDLHGQSNPYPAGGGKNLYYLPDIAQTTVNGVTYSITKGILSINGTATAGITINNVSLSLPSNTYTASAQLISGSMSGVNSSYNLYTSDEVRKWLVPFGASGVSVKVTATGDVSGTYIAINTGAIFTNARIAFQFEVGSDMTAYAPYSNICPISGWTGVNVTDAGKNLYPYETVAKYAWAFSQQYALANAVNPVFLKANTTYTLTIDSGNKLYRMRFWRADGTLIEVNTTAELNQLISVASGTNYQLTYYSAYKFVGYTNGANANNVCQITPTIDIWWDFVTETDASLTNQLEVGSTATPYQSYTGSTLSLSWQSSAGTVYGGELDVTTGVLTVDHGYADMGDLSWTKANWGFYTSISGAKNFASGEDVGLLCSMYKTATSRSQPEQGLITIQNNLFRVGDTNYENETAFTSAVDGQTIVYWLATPLTYQLTPSDLASVIGANNLFADTGAVTAILRKATGDLAYQDTVDYETQVTNLPTEIAQREATMKATRNYSAGALIEVGGKLYKASTGIASGANLVVNSNVTLTTVEAELAIKADASAVYTKAQTDALLNQKAPVIEETDTGAIVSFSDGADGLPLSALSVAVTPVQAGSGDPAPDNVRAISGWTQAKVTRTGKNLFDVTNANEGKSISATGTLADNANRITSDYIRVSAGDYYLSNVVTSGDGRAVATYDMSKTFVRIVGLAQSTMTSGVITINEGECYMRVQGYIATKNTIQVEEGSEGTPYEPSNGATLTIPFGQTVYGGTLNVLTGVMTVTQGYHLCDGTDGWINEVESGTCADGACYIGYIQKTNKNIKNATGFMANSNAFKYIPNTSGFSSMHKGEFNGAGAYLRFVLPDGITNLTQLNTWLSSNNVQIIFDLGTPQTLTLTAQQLATLKLGNNIWADAGNVTVTWKADTKQFILNAINEALA